MASPSFDLVVLGTGAAGQTVASACRKDGWKVAIVDCRPFGGTCALRGCDPKKVLADTAEAVERVRMLEGKGVEGKGVALDWPALMRFKRGFTEPVPRQREQGFEKEGIVSYHGVARFTGPCAVQVEEHALEARRFLIATGAKPRPLGIPGEELVSTSTDFLDLDRLPRRVLFLGGGYISTEFAHIAARAGAEATVVHRGKRLLEPFDADLVSQLEEATREAGIKLRMRTEAVGVRRVGGALAVRVKGPEGESEIEADLVVHGAGRVPAIDELDLPAANVEREKRGVKVNEHLQSVSNPAVYAAGDAAASGGPPLTPVASHEGEVAAANLLKGNHRKPDYRGVASVVFALPRLAAVGLTEEEARAKGLRFRVNHAETSKWFSSAHVGARHSGHKVLIEEESDRILGAHLLGPEAPEVINLFALAIRFGIPADELERALPSYPTRGSDLAYML